MLKALMWPAIKLMGRLSYAAKFGIIRITQNLIIFMNTCP